MNASQRRKHRREQERAFAHFRRAGIPVEQAHHWAAARATRIMSESYDPELPFSVLHYVRRFLTGIIVAALVAVVVGVLLLAI